MKSKIYKVMSRSEWEAACAVGVYRGSGVDLADGFIHFSDKDQSEETVAKHFRGQTDLVLIRFSTNAFSDELKWEPSRGGDLFPHLYAELDTDLAEAVFDLIDNQDGSHKFPDAY